MNKKLEGRVAVVTGSGRGIGRAIAQALASEGASVGLVARSEDQISETQNLIESKGGSAVALPGDVTVRADAENVMKEMINRYKRLDILVNNAGGLKVVGPVGEDDPDAWRYEVSLNLFGTYLFSHASVPHMRGSGVIVNLGSGSGIRAFPFCSAYGCSKAAVLHFTETLARELEPRGIAVFAIRPGSVRTSRTRITDTPKGKKYLGPIANLPSGMRVPPERAAGLVVRLCDPEAAVLSGRIISVLDDLDLLIKESEQVQKNQLYVLRMNTLDL